MFLEKPLLYPSPILSPGPEPPPPEVAHVSTHHIHRIHTASHKPASAHSHTETQECHVLGTCNDTQGGSCVRATRFCVGTELGGRLQVSRAWTSAWGCLSERLQTLRRPGLQLVDRCPLVFAGRPCGPW